MTEAAFIGLGIMGSRMAQNLLSGGVPLRVYNRSPEPREKLADAGAAVASSYGGCAADADLVFTMLSTPQVVAELALGDSGFLSRMNRQAIWIDCSTVDPSFSRRCHQEASDLGVRFVDAPVAGSKPQAEGAELLFFVGGEDKDVREVHPYLEMMGKQIIHVGDPGQGSALKILVNSLLAQSLVAFSETVLLGEKLGLESGFLLDLLPDLPVTAPFIKAKAEKIQTEDYSVQFPLEWMEKDLDLVTKTADGEGQPLFLANLVKELFQAARESGLAREDFSAVHHYLRGLNDQGKS
ncbi:MAG: NAD(P)-dependent oxidoreductase [Anaerolineales bacterium]|nr:NAD(P)-dependent oxidoreductase [Anaerolineales bacterium]